MPASWPETLLPERHRQLIVGVFFGLLLLVGLRLVRDYGSFADEVSCRESGQISFAYLYEFVPPAWLPAQAAARLAALPARSRLPRYRDRDYGVALELPMTMLEKLSGYHDLRRVYLLRHTCVWLVCWVGLLAFYWLGTQRLGSWRLGLLAAVALLLSPRQFADFFYNCKDGVFLACYLIAMATALAFVRRPGWRLAAAHALACAIAIDVRLMAVLVPVLTLGLLGWRILLGAYPGRRVLGPVLAYVGLLVLLIIMFWPYLWPAPLAHFTEAFANMSVFRWAAPILHQGRIIPVGERLPWSYAPIWIGITTPLVYLIGWLLSALLLLRQLARRRWAADGLWQDLLCWGLGLGPLAAVIILHSVLYDGWRQLYFVYPPLLLLALRGLVALGRWPGPVRALRPYWPAGVGAGVAAALLTLAAQMVQLHPLENLYFNPLAGPHPERRYEYDYWGLSFRQGLAWIMAHDARPRVLVRSNLQVTDIANADLLPPAERARLVIVRDTTAPADYYLTTYRYHWRPYAFGPPVDSLRVGPEGRVVFDIFRWR